MSAFLIPENIPSRGDLPSSLQDVARALRDFLDQDVTVWLEHDGDEPYLIILDPAAGLLFLRVTPAEARGVSGGRMTMPRELGRSEAEVLSGLRSLAEDRRDHLDSALENDVPVTPGAAFPSVDRFSAMDQGFSEDDLQGLLLKEDFRPETLREAIHRVIASKPSHQLTEPEERLVRGILHPEIIIDPVEVSTEGQLVFRAPETDGEDVVRVLDREQERLARRLDGGYRVVRGVAGSGKTLVLTFRARFLSESFPQWRILLTCYNICLSKALQHQLMLRRDGADLSNVDVRHIDSLARNVLLKAGSSRSQANSPNDWQRIREDALEELRRRRDLAEYDAVLVDEGQDFDGTALDIAWASLKDGRDQFVLALDAAQNIYRKSARWNPPGMTARGRTSLLGINYRNTKEILEFAWRFLAAGDATEKADDLLDDPGIIVPPEATSRRGPKPQVIDCRDARAEIRAIVDLVLRRHEEGTPWNQMAVLYGHPEPWQRTLYFEAKDRGIPYFWVTNNRYRSARRKVIECGNVVRAFTLHAAKGLEFSRVFMCGLNKLYDPQGNDSDALRRLVYVGMTRAMDELVVTVSGEGEIGRAIQAAKE